MNFRGAIYGLGLGLVLAPVSLIAFEGLVWGWWQNVPDYMIGVSMLWGICIGIGTTSWGLRYL